LKKKKKRRSSSKRRQRKKRRSKLIECILRNRKTLNLGTPACMVHSSISKYIHRL